MQKKVVITGASRGIGYALAALFAKAGYMVYANYNKTYEPLRLLAAACAEQGLALTPVRADVTSKQQVAALFEAAGGADVLINNAGIAQTKEFMLLNEDDWDNMLNANLKSAFLCTQAALPAMFKKKNGSIINISSVWGITGGSCEAHYSASKAGLIGLTKALAKELGPSGIRVNCIAPGVISTDMISGLSPSDRQALSAQTPLNTLGTPNDIADAALFLANSEFITGEVLNVSGGFYI